MNVALEICLRYFAKIVCRAVYLAAVPISALIIRAMPNFAKYGKLYMVYFKVNLEVIPGANHKVIVKLGLEGRLHG